MTKQNKILIADDESLGRQLLEAILYPEGYEVIFADNGVNALNSIIQDMPDLVLLDVMMPLMDGFEVCKRVRENKEIAHTPIFLITALDDRDSKIKGIDSGADDYISKPFDRLEILAKIKNRTTLQQFRQKQGILSESQAIRLESSINVNILNILTEIILEQSPVKNENIDIYCSASKNSSKHLFTNIEFESGTYYILISNNQEGINKVLVNSICILLLKEYCLNNPGSPSEIIHDTLKKIESIKSRFKEAEFQNFPASMFILFKEKANKKIIAAGLNQTIYYTLNHPYTSETSKLLPYQVAGLNNQNLELSGIENVFIVSYNVIEHLNETEMNSLLDQFSYSAQDNDFTKMEQGKLNEVDDVLIIKLSL